MPPERLRKKDLAGNWPSILNGIKAILGEKALRKGVPGLLKMNQPDGFDCPGCAWPEEKEMSSFEFCENGMKAAAAETTSKVVGADFFQRYSVSQLKEKAGYWLEQQGRLTTPMAYHADSDKYYPVDWESAFALIGKTLRGLEHPEQAAFYTSGRTSNEAAFLYQLFVREFGTNNLPDCSNMCHESSGVAMTESVGVGKGTVVLEDFQKADLILILGQNPGTNHPRMLSTLEKARKNGCRIITFNPIEEAGLQNFIHPQNAGALMTQIKTPLSDRYYRLHIGGDQAALMGIMKHLLALEEQEGGVLDTGFIREHTDGFAALKYEIERTAWDVIERESGLSRADLESAGEVYARSSRVIACWAMGLTQHENAVATIQTLVDLMLLRGNIGREGAGLCPVRGHSNVQGDRTMGITEKPKPAFLDRLESAFGIRVNRNHGADVVETIHKMAKGDIKAFVAMGGNFASATPDSAMTEKALSQCDLTVHISTKLNRSHLVAGKQALILPCLGRSERDLRDGVPQKVTVEDSMSMVHASSGVNRPAGPLLLSEPAIVAGMARATLPDSKVNWSGLSNDYGLIRRKIEAVVPGFKNFNIRIQRPGGFHLRNAAREREWHTDSGKARLMGHALKPIDLEKDELRLMTIRSHDQYNTTIYGLNDRYRGVKGDREVLFMNREDMEERGLAEGRRVRVVSRDALGKRRETHRFRAREYPIPKGMAAAYFPEANVLVSIHSVAAKSNTPVSKLVPVRVESL